MAANTFYPSLSNLIQVDEIPSALAVIQGGIDDLFKHFYYKDFQAQKSASGDVGFYQLKIITYKRLGIEIPGTNGLALILNPSITPGGTTDFPISLGYRWDILKYVKGFDVTTNPLSPEFFFDLFLNISGATKEELLTEVIYQFYQEEDIDADPIQRFVDDYNQNHPSVQPLVKSMDPDEGVVIADIANQLAMVQQVDVFQFVQNDFVATIIDNDSPLTQLKLLFSKWINNISEDDIKSIIIPKAFFSIDQLSIGIQFPSNIFRELNADGTPAQIPDPQNQGQQIDKPTLLTFDIASLKYSTEKGFEFNLAQNLNINFPYSEILKSGFTIDLHDLKLDLSRTQNIPEAIADGRPEDFIGVYVVDAEISLPKKWFSEPKQGDLPPGIPSLPTVSIKGTNLLIGTGGISGKISLVGNGKLYKKFGDFWIGLDKFSMTFQQNAITESLIKGSILIPSFKDEKGDPAWVSVEIHIGQNGEFKITASVDPPVQITIPNVFSFGIKSLFGGKNAEGKSYIGISGDIDFLLQEPIGQFLPDKVDIKKLVIYDDGKYEFEGGTIVLPKAFELKLGPAKIGISAIHLGSYEKEGRKYKYFGFDGGVSVNPGGVDVRGKGVKFYYTVDNEKINPQNPKDAFKWFIRLESLAIDIMIPGGSDPAKAAVIIKGYLSIKDPKIDTSIKDPKLIEVLKNATEYAGGVYISIPKFRGLEISAAMRFTPQVPAFIVDLGVEFSPGFLLGTTGLMICGFRALLGKRYVATKFAAGIPDDGEWWQYYKAKIDPDYKEGIQISKFSIKEGFSFGAGVSIATASDSGKVLSAKLFFLLSLPDVFLFQGQAQFLKGKISLDAVPDPPFFAIIAITKKSIEAGFGINYKIPDDTGKLVTVDGVTEMGFFFGDSAAWYFNIGREAPDSMRIQARVFDILNMYFYFMISNQGIRAGAGVGIELKKSFGPLSAELSAYMDTKGRISFRPKQIGGAMQMGGTVALKCCGFGFSVWGGATLAAEAPHPHIITGEFEVCVKVLKKERCARFEFTWNFEKTLNDARNGVLVDVIEGQTLSNTADIGKIAKATHMVTGETLNLAYAVLYDGPGPITNSNPIPPPSDWITNDALDDFRIPVDSFIDVEFKKGLNVVSGKNVEKIGGLSSPCEYIEFVPPQRGKSEQVRHEYFLDSIEILYWDNDWKPYDFYTAMSPLFSGEDQAASCVDTDVLSKMKWGYWQQQRPGYNNKLRILATTPLSYAAKTDSLPVEDLGINGGTILCPGEAIPKTCVVFGREQVARTFAANALHSHKGITFKITTKEGIVLNKPYLGVDNGLVIQPGDAIEIFFKEPMKEVHFLLNSGAPRITVGYYTRTRVVDSNTKGGEVFSGGLPVFRYDLIESKSYTKGDWAGEIDYTNAQKNIDYIKITSISCYEAPRVKPVEIGTVPVIKPVVLPISPLGNPALGTTITCLNTDEQIEINRKALQTFIAALIKNKHLTATAVQLNPQHYNLYNGVFMGTSLYPTNPYRERKINLIQGYLSGTTLLFGISDDLDYNCNYSFDLLRPIAGFSFANIDSIVSLTPYTTGAAAGTNYTFLLTVKAIVNRVLQDVQIIGKSCLPMAYCYDNCSTFLYRVCFLPYADYLLNQTIPTKEVQAVNTEALLTGINKTLHPIWRPNTTYAIRFKTSDNLYADGSTTAMKTYHLDMVYGFKTAGPVGHYHNYPFDNDTGTPKIRQDFAGLYAMDKADEFKLQSLKYYIDYPKCYPNADGDIMNAKPLFYLNAELRVFYLYNHVYEFYNNWKNPNDATNDIAHSSLAVVIQDPLDSGIEEKNPTLSFVGNSIPHTPEQEGFPASNINNINNDINILNNILLNGGNPCASSNTPNTPTSVAPIDISTQKKLDLKPLKLYTAQFVAKYNPLIINPTTQVGEYAKKDYESVVHSYVFQTSKYSSFEEQVNSYILKRDSNGQILREAVFVMTIDPITDIGLATSVVMNDEASIPDELKLQYADPFDRWINGVLKLDYNVLHAAVNTEFNIIKSSDQPSRTLGILIRNPEPFNDPKLPPEASETLSVSRWVVNKWGKPSDFYVIYSKDRSKMFVTSSAMDFNLTQLAKLKFTFRYKLYNGVSYADASVVDVVIGLNSSPAK